MLNLLIVDDEQFTREMIKESIAWNELGIGNVKTARNGINALDIINENPPHILLCDVRMPKMNGIELATKVRELYPNCIIIFISGHADKEYLKSAITLKAIDYIEKPFSLDSLTSVIKKAILLFKDQQSQLLKYETLKKQLIDNMHLFQQDIVLEMIKPNSDMISIKEKLSSIDFDFYIEGYFFCSTIIINQPYKPTLPFDNSLCNNILKILQSEPNVNFKFISSFDTENKLIVICSAKKQPQKTDINSFLGNTLYKLNNFNNKEFSFSIGVGDFVDNINQIYNSYIQSIKAVYKQFYFEANNIFYFKETSGTEFIFNRALYSQFKELLEKSDIINAVNFVNTLTEDIRSSEDNNIDYIKNIFFSLLIIIFEEAKKKDLIEQVNLSEKNFIWKEIDNIIFLSKLSEYIIKNITSIFSRSDEKDSKCKKTQEIKTYIYEHFQDKDLTTNSIAQNIYLSQTYLCAFFKKSTGETLNDFITKVRIEKAKEYLKDPKSKLIEVANNIGLTDVNYFSTLFKKHLGCTPSEYRSKFRND